MKEYFKPALILLIICFVTVGAVATVYNVTINRIEELQEMAKQENMRKVLPDVDTFETEILNLKVDQYGATILELNTGYKNGAVAGYVYVVTTSGYGGDVTVITGLDSSGTVTGVIMGDNNETPGLGREAAKPEFIDQFTGAKEATLKVVKSGASAPNEIDSVSGATFTSNAVTRAVNAALNYQEGGLK